MQRTTQQSLFISILIHAGIVGLGILFLWVQSLLTRPEPVIFELVPQAAAPAPQQPVQDQPRDEPIKPLEVPVTEPLKPLPDVPDLPEPEPEPPPPKPKPKPPEPKPEPKKTLSYEEWARNRKLPDRVQRVQQPRRTQTQPVPEIETNVRDRLKKTLSPITLQGADIGQIENSDALQRYLAELRQRIQSAFEPSGSGLEAEAYFTVTASGRILNGRIQRSSGNAGFDQSVLRTLQIARSPGPPPGEREYTFSLVFQSE